MAPALPEALEVWRAAGERVRIGRHELFARSLGARDASADSTLLVVHGFPESSISFRHNVEALAARFDRVVLVDLLGFGLSDKPQDYSYSLFEQTDALLEAWRALGVRGGHLLGHDMGDTIVTELVARRERGLLPGWLEGGFGSVTFTDGNMVMELAKLRLGQSPLRVPGLGALFGRAGRYPIFRQQVRSASGASLPEEDTQLMWAAMQHGGGARVQHRIIGYLDERRRFQNGRWLPALAATTLPVHLCWGATDRVSPPAVAEHLRAKVCPGAQLSWLPRAGHFCQQEDPEGWNAAVVSFYARLGVTRRAR